MQYLNQSDIERIISQVMKSVNEAQEGAVVTECNTKKEEKIEVTNGVWINVADAIDAAEKAHYALFRNHTKDDRARMIESIRKHMLSYAVELANEMFEETKMGILEHKIAKLTLAIEKTPGVEDLTTKAVSGDTGLMIEEYSPFGVIGAVTPVTNPVETIVNNSISMIASGNSVVFNPHPSAKKSSVHAVKLINEAIMMVGGPANTVNVIENPTIETVNEIVAHPKVRLLVGTGGPKLVKTILSSGKKGIGAGAGNPPVVVDETADVALAAKCIVEGASFDNNLLCLAEKEVFVVDKIYDGLLYEFLKNDTYILSQDELKRVMDLTLTKEEVNGKIEYHVAKTWVGKCACKIAKELGLPVKDGIKLLLCEVDKNHPYVQLEQMMPVLPLVKCENINQAIDYAIEAEHGNRHTASVFSTNVKNMTKMAKSINTTIFVKNSTTLAGVGYGGEGHTTYTIAGPTGEGITSAKTFTRTVRCVLAEGDFRVV